MKIELSNLALEDLRAGYSFYENQAEGLGEYFLDSLSADIDSLILYAGIHPVFFSKYFRLLSNRFPFAIYYLIDGAVIKVDAVLDCRSKPSLHKSRFET